MSWFWMHTSKLCGSQGEDRTHADNLAGYIANNEDAVGAVKVVIQSADLAERLRTPKPFARVRTHGHADTRSTKSSEERTYSPNWLSESIYVLVYSPTEQIDIEVLNHHRFRRPTVIGCSTVPLSTIVDQGTRLGARVLLSKADSTEIAGELLCDFFYYPAKEIVSEKSDGSYDGTVTFKLHQANGLRQDTQSSQPPDLLAVMSLGWTEPPLFSIPATRSFGQIVIWNARRQFLCFNRDFKTVVVKLIDPESPSDIYGHVSIPVNDLLSVTEASQEWWPLSGCTGGQLRMTASWKSIDFSKHTND